MKIKNLFAILLALTLLASTFVLPTSAKERTNNNFEIIIIDEVSEETKAKIEKHFENGEPYNDNRVTTYGLTCTLFGHKLESTAVTTTTHKVSATSPRCLKRTYKYDACTRCDYENSTLIGQEFIICC